MPSWREYFLLPIAVNKMDIQDPIINDWLIEKGQTKKKTAKTLTLYNYQYIPVVEGKELLGYAKVSDLTNSDMSLKNIDLLDPISVNPNYHLLDIIGTLSQSELDIVGIVDSNNSFSGIYSEKTVVQSISRSFTAYSEGAIVLVKIGARDFQLSKIVSIAESHNLKVIGIFTEMTETGEYLIHLKLNSNTVQSFISSLSRFDYKVEQFYHVFNEHDDLENNYNMLMDYLDI
jgi:CBS domain containing-hemolysin-like protein